MVAFVEDAFISVLGEAEASDLLVVIPQRKIFFGQAPAEQDSAGVTHKVTKPYIWTEEPGFLGVSDRTNKADYRDTLYRFNVVDDDFARGKNVAQELEWLLNRQVVNITPQGGTGTITFLYQDTTQEESPDGVWTFQVDFLIKIGRAVRGSYVRN